MSQSQPEFARRTTPPPPIRRGRRLRIFAAFALASVLVGGGIGAVGAWTWIFSDLPTLPDKQALWSLNREPGMVFEAATGEVIARRGPKHGRAVRVAELPPYVPKAFLAAEDRRFYNHGAADLRGIARAMRENLREGEVVQGGSTISQQVAKVIFLNPDRTWKRKLQDLALAYQLEQTLTKDEILELYMNRAYFGAGAYGLQAASETYFGKPANKLTISEASVLAGLLRAPSKLALTKDFLAALQRSRFVLAAMRQEGWITRDEEQIALIKPPVLALEKREESEMGYVLDLAAAEALRIVGPDAPDLVVRLTIDPKLQAVGQSTVRQAIAADGDRLRAGQAAMVALAPDGAIKALVGGVSHRESPFNRAVQAKRQPGSAFKPIIYAAALENGIGPGDIRQDKPVNIGGWRPANYAGGYRGDVSVEDSLARSINTVAVQLGEQVGTAKLGEIARRFGFGSVPERPGLSVSLGAYEVSLLELTSAYQVFQNAGSRPPPFLIQQISNSRGDPLFIRTPSAGIPVYERERARTMVRMMSGVITHGTGLRAALDRPAAGKTGTSQDFRDAWFIGFTADYAVGVWVGNDDNLTMRGVTGGDLPAVIWRRFMSYAHHDLPARDLFGVDAVASEEIADEGGMLPKSHRALYEAAALRAEPQQELALQEPD